MHKHSCLFVLCDEVCVGSRCPVYFRSCCSFSAHLIIHSYFRCGTLVSADSTGAVQFWDSEHGTLLQAHTSHKGDVNALAAAPSHNRVFSAGSDGQVQTLRICGA